MTTMNLMKKNKLETQPEPSSSSKWPTRRSLKMSISLNGYCLKNRKKMVPKMTRSQRRKLSQIFNLVEQADQGSLDARTMLLEEMTILVWTRLMTRDSKRRIRRRTRLLILDKGHLRTWVLPPSTNSRGLRRRKNRSQQVRDPDLLVKPRLVVALAQIIKAQDQLTILV